MHSLPMSKTRIKLSEWYLRESHIIESDRGENRTLCLQQLSQTNNTILLNTTKIVYALVNFMSAIDLYQYNYQHNFSNNILDLELINEECGKNFSPLYRFSKLDVFHPSIIIMDSFEIPTLCNNKCPTYNFFQGEWLFCHFRGSGRDLVCTVPF